VANTLKTVISSATSRKQSQIHELSQFHSRVKGQLVMDLQARSCLKLQGTKWQVSGPQKRSESDKAAQEAAHEERALDFEGIGHVARETPKNDS